jgi:tetratricopeptide (TPR) repeat protein
VPARVRGTWLVAIPLALLAVVAFLPVLGNSFVDWDDELNFLKNPYYRGLGGAQVGWAWTTFWLGVYQPLAWLLLEAEYACWGLEPWGYHLTSLLLHAANAVVLYVLTVAVLLRCRPERSPESPWAYALGAGLASALFAVHPLRVEAVAWASCQPYLPCALFSMLAILAYLRATGPAPARRWGWLVTSWALFAAALLSKAVAVSLPAVLLILDVYPLRRLGGGPGRWFGPAARPVWWEKVPFVLLSLAGMGLALAAKQHVLSVVPIEQDGAAVRIAQACYGVWFYLLKTGLPLDLMAVYPLPRRIDWLQPRFLLSILGTLAMSLALVLLRRRRPGLLAAWLSYLAILAPNSGLIRVSDQLVADRYSYMALLAGVIAAAAGLGRFGRPPGRLRPGALGIIAAGLVALLGLIPLTWDQCRVWRSPVSLWTHALDHGLSRGKAHNGLGAALVRQGRFAEAAAHYAEAMRLDPGDAEAYNNLAMILAACPDATYRDGRRAVAAATRACALTGWKSPYFLDTLAAAAAEAGDFDAAVAWQTRAIALLRDRWKQEDYRTRLALYQAKQPYREVFPGAPPAERRPGEATRAELMTRDLHPTSSP